MQSEALTSDANLRLSDRDWSWLKHKHVAVPAYKAYIVFARHGETREIYGFEQAQDARNALGLGQIRSQEVYCLLKRTGEELEIQF